MKERVFDKKDYNSYKDLYKDICISLGVKNIVDIFEPDPINYNENVFDDLLWSGQDEEITYIFENFDTIEFQQRKTKDDQGFDDIITSFKQFAWRNKNIKMEIHSNKEVIFNKKDYQSYKDFYKDICIKLDAKDDMNCLEPEDLQYNPNILNEFLWDCKKIGIKYIFIGFDTEEIQKLKTTDDIEYSYILKVFKRFIDNYPNNSLEIRSE